MISFGRLNRFTILTIFASIFIILYSIMMSSIFFDNLSHIKKTIITTTLFIIMLSVYYKAISHNFFINKDDFCEKIGKWAFYSFVFMVIIGFIQFFMKLGLVPKGVSEQITLLFSYRTVNRIQMVSGEPSMMVRNILFLGVFIYFYYYGKYRKIVIFLIIFFLLVSGSTFGYVTIFLFFIVYIVLFKPKLIFNLRILSFISLLLILIWVLMNNFLDDYTLNKIDIVLKILTNLDLKTLSTVVQSDGSAFQRLMNPIIGFMSGEYTFYLGTGLDGYRYIYPYYINEYFSFSLNYESVYAAVSGESYITPKSLYSKIYSELGIVSFLLFMFFNLYLYLKILLLNSKTKIVLSVLFSLSLVLIIQNDSIIYLNYFFIIIFITLQLNYTKIKNIKE
ncbi:O-antigen ligase family protein [Arcobacter sp. YIC-464]|uniref:O-antigen ligase family protein n=1 Tax=Arcobacter sp. YIC-464 TaxID=3376631 RepID=UPI003C1859E8